MLGFGYSFGFQLLSNAFYLMFQWNPYVHLCMLLIFFDILDFLIGAHVQVVKLCDET